MSDLVARLREIACEATWRGNFAADRWPPGVCGEAADAIERLQGENAALSRNIRCEQDLVSKARAAIKRVEAVCDQRAKSAPSAGFGSTDLEWTLTVRSIRAALADKKEPTDE